MTSVVPQKNHSNLLGYDFYWDSKPWHCATMATVVPQKIILKSATGKNRGISYDYGRFGYDFYCVSCTMTTVIPQKSFWRVQHGKLYYETIVLYLYIYHIHSGASRKCFSKPRNRHSALIWSGDYILPLPNLWKIQEYKKLWYRKSDTNTVHIRKHPTIKQLNIRLSTNAIACEYCKN